MCVMYVTGLVNVKPGVEEGVVEKEITIFVR
jgi:hypothetical protein